MVFQWKSCHWEGWKITWKWRGETNTDPQCLKNTMFCKLSSSGRGRQDSNSTNPQDHSLVCGKIMEPGRQGRNLWFWDHLGCWEAVFGFPAWKVHKNRQFRDSDRNSFTSKIPHWEVLKLACRHDSRYFRKTHRWSTCRLPAWCRSPSSQLHAFGRYWLTDWEKSEKALISSFYYSTLENYSTHTLYILPERERPGIWTLHYYLDGGETPMVPSSCTQMGSLVWLSYL